MQLHAAGRLQSGGLALLEGRLELCIQRAGAAATETLQTLATQVWREGAGGWRLRRAQTTRLAPAQP